MGHIRKVAPMHIAIRPATEEDTNACGRICYEGFRAVNERYGFPVIFPSVDVATRRVGGFIRHASVFAVVAEANGRIVGFNFLSERDPIRAVGPIVVDPAAQGHGTGRKLMEAVLERARGARGAVFFRILSMYSHSRSMRPLASTRGKFLWCSRARRRPRRRRTGRYDL
ncbi:GNAT family N-acetyltransferase [Bradyrhizobium centrolobii]|uniref:GNAT family N-acetyltransferase n=1 Tax=Bradyrhizobium centrolobii TaxID=1505087 RepID=UPI0009EDD31D